MKIDTAHIISLNPCLERLEHYLAHYPKWTGSLADFLDLENITINDKRWVYFRSLPRNIVPLVAADIAETVLHIYEAHVPGDLRPRKAIEAARSGDASAVRTAAAAAAYASSSATSSATSSAAASAAHAAYAAASAHAAIAATSATSAHAASASAADAADAAAHEKQQIEIMKKWAKGLSDASL